MSRNASISSRGTMQIPKHTRSTSAGSTVLVNLDIYVVRATIGRDISSNDDDLIVLFRRNSKEITSEPTRWHPDHIAEWNQHVGIQTSLLRSTKNHQLHQQDANANNEYLSKEYEVVLVALPSHSAVALFTVDFATIVQTQRANRPKAFRISPTKCRDLAATLEFEVVWEYASPPPPSSSATPAAPLTPTSSSIATGSSSLSMAGRRTNVSVVSMSSQGSELTANDFPGGGGSASCNDCRSSKRRLERKEMQIVQLENFLKESQKRIDSLVFENEELLVREDAETKNAAQYRALNMRLLQELEMAFQFCVQQMLQAQEKAKLTGSDVPPPLFMFLPQFEFMERVKKFHTELDLIFGGSSTADLHDSSAGKPLAPHGGNPMDAWKTFDFRNEMEAALERNQRLQQQLEFLNHSFAYEGGAGGDANVMMSQPPELRRNLTNASNATSGFSIADMANSAADHQQPHSPSPLGSSRSAPVRTITEQLNALERENFALKGKLETAVNDLKLAQHHGQNHPLHHNHRNARSPSEYAETTTSGSGSTSSRPSSITASLALLPVVLDESPFRLEVDQLRDEKHELVHELETLKHELDAMSRERDHALQQLTVSTSAAVPAAPVPDLAASGTGFLNKIYMDVGKAKVALEEKVKRLQQELNDAKDDNIQLQLQLNTTVKRVSEEEDEDDAHPATTNSSGRSSNGGGGDERLLLLDAQIQQLHHVVDEKTSQLKVQEQELEFMKQHLMEKAEEVGELDKAKQEIESERASTKQALAKANKTITTLEIKLETLQHELMELQQLHEQQQQDHEHEKQQLQAKQQQQLQQQQRTMAATAAATLQQHQQQQQQQQPGSSSSTGGGDRGEEVVELTKQLKLARQEVMQLRYRSNNLESVHEKLEDALKEKKTLQVKLTALEGQLYEQRSRTISGSNFSTTTSGSETTSNKDAALLELQRKLDHKTSQLNAAQREVDALRRDLSRSPALATCSTTSDADLAIVEAKVDRFSVEITRLCERNEAQVLRINALSERVEKVSKEKYELEAIMKEMLREIDTIEGLRSACSSGASSSSSSPAPSPPRDEIASNSRSSSSREPSSAEELLEEKPLAVLPPPAIAITTTRQTPTSGSNKAMERYANALKSSFPRRGSGARPPAPSPSHSAQAAAAAQATASESVPKSKVAQMIKNFSSDQDQGSSNSIISSRNNSVSSSTDEPMGGGGVVPRRSTLRNSMKKITKIDFRQRQTSNASSTTSNE